MTDRLAGKVAIITGGASGIGRTTAELFSSENAKVLLVDRDSDMLASAAEHIRNEVSGAEIDTAVADVAEEGDAHGAVARALKTFGTLDILVNNAAIRDVGTVEESKQENWDKLWAVNVLGAVNFYKAAAEALRKSGKASIINVSSIGAVCAREDWGIYDATKAALLALTRTLASEEAAHGIRVNALCAGGTVTPFTVGRAESRDQTAEDLRNELREDNLLARWAEPIEIAHPILWLASDEASFITGATLMVDGGRSVK